MSFLMDLMFNLVGGRRGRRTPVVKKINNIPKCRSAMEKTKQRRGIGSVGQGLGEVVILNKVAGETPTEEVRFQ